uniref:Secreted protein n=1 Tax=Trichogramma kaykai TaxID=54128 RepID=A0ABD2XLP1_9HYME
MRCCAFCYLNVALSSVVPTTPQCLGLDDGEQRVSTAAHALHRTRIVSMNFHSCARISHRIALSSGRILGRDRSSRGRSDKPRGISHSTANIIDAIVRLRGVKITSFLRNYFTNVANRRIMQYVFAQLYPSISSAAAARRWRTFHCVRDWTLPHKVQERIISAAARQQMQGVARAARTRPRIKYIIRILHRM